MTTSDYLLNIALIALVVLQVRGRALSAINVLIPVGVVAWAASQYLHAFPTAGNDLVLELGLAAVGALLGIGCALTSRVEHRSDGSVFVRAGVTAAILWVVGVGSRLAFQIYVSHGGSSAIGRFSVAHQITTGQAWVTALILMAFAEVFFRTGGIWLRASRARRMPAPAPAPAFEGATGSRPAVG